MYTFCIYKRPPNVYTDDMRLYKTRDLQKNTKEVLDSASKDTVIIQRGSVFYRLVSVDMFDQLEESQEKTPPVENIATQNPEKIKSEPMARTIGDVLSEIRQLEADKEEELRYCQDTEYGAEIDQRYDNQLKELWEEYNGLCSMQTE